MHPHHEHHSHGHHHHQDIRNLGLAFWLNFGFAIIEIIGGLLTNSVAILSDALHDLGDSMSLGLAWYFQRLSERGKDRYYSYGYQRFSVLGALITSTILIVGSIVIVAAAVGRLMEPQEAHGLGMMGLAVLGVLVNGLAVFRLRGSQSVNAKALMLHLMEDVLGWVAVLIGSIFIYLFQWHIIDPLLSLGIATYILVNVYKNLRVVLRILLQGVPIGIDLETVRSRLLEHPQIVDVHDIHLWTIDGEYHVMSSHVVLRSSEIPLSQTLPIKKEIEHWLLHLGIEHSTIAFEVVDDDSGE